MFPQAVDPYRVAGWEPVPLPRAAKASPPPGTTGRSGEPATQEQIAAWKEEYADGNIAIVLAEDMVGIDVDDYASKTGALNLEQFAADHDLPPLPPTWVSSSKPAPSGIRIYRLNPLLMRGRKINSEVCAAVDLIQHDYRYVLVPPSIHPDGSLYRWRDPEGNETNEIPHKGQIDVLPPEWQYAISKPTGSASLGPALHPAGESSDEAYYSRDAAQAWLADQQGEGIPWENLFATIIDQAHIDAIQGTRYVAMLRAVAIVIGDITKGTMPGTAAFELEREFQSLYENPPPGKKAKEFRPGSTKFVDFWNMVAGAVGKYSEGGPWRDRIADDIEARRIAEHFAEHPPVTDGSVIKPLDDGEDLGLTSDLASPPDSAPTPCSSDPVGDDESVRGTTDAEVLGLVSSTVEDETPSIASHMRAALAEADEAGVDRLQARVLSTEIFRHRVAADVALQAERELARRKARAMADEVDLAEGAADRLVRYPMLLPDLASAMRSGVVRSSAVLGSELGGGILLRRGHTARLLADFKAGKTTVGLDFLRASLTGDPFLGHVWCEPVDGTSKVAHVDPELDDDWGHYFLAAFGDLDDEFINRRLVRVDLKDAKAQGWTWESEADRRWLGDQCVGCERVFMDSVLEFLPHGQGGDTASALSDVHSFLDRLDAWKKWVGISELVFSIHMNRAREERSFGSIAWDAKAQALWKLVKDEGVRFFSADEGRAGTSFEEGKVLLSADGRPLLDLATSRKVAAVERKEEERARRITDLEATLLDGVRDAGGLHPSKDDLEGLVGGKAVECREALRNLITTGRLIVYKEGRAHRHCLPGDLPPGSSPLRL